MAKEKQDQEHVFVTEDKAVREAGRISKADAEILQSVQTGEGLITIKSVEELQEMAKAAAERFDEFKELCSPMTLAQAKAVRKLRVEMGSSWRAVAEACYKLGWGKWFPPSNQIMGMVLCERAALIHSENYMEAPWN